MKKVFPILIVLCTQFMYCKQTPPSIAYGKEVWVNNCRSCHTYKLGTYPRTLADLAKMDSVALIHKLDVLKRNYLHDSLLHQIKYTDYEINSLQRFIFYRKRIK